MAWGGVCCEACPSLTAHILLGQVGGLGKTASISIPIKTKQLAGFCFWFISSAGKHCQLQFLVISFKPEITDLLSICLCVQPSPSLFPLSSNFEVIIKNKLGSEGNIFNFTFVSG